MKTAYKNIITAFSALLITATAGFAGPNHGEKAEAGPNGGRVITSVQSHAEFFVTPERKVKITFLDESGKVVPPADQIVTVTTGDRSAPVKLAFTKSGDSLISDGVVPEGNGLPTIVQIKAQPDAKAEIAKFNLNLSICPGCKLAEYACTCAH